MLQSVFLRIVSKIGLFAMQITGLWPFSYDYKSNKFKFLWYFTLLPIFIMGYPLLVALFWSKYISNDIFGKNTVLTVISIGFVAFNASNFIFLFISQYLKFKEINKLIMKSQRVIFELNNELDIREFRYGTFLSKFVVKSVFFMSLLIYSMKQSMSRYTSFQGNFLVHMMSYLPNAIMKLHPDIFFGGLLLLHFYLQQINVKVSKVLNKAQDLSENQDLEDQRKYEKMINFCELSDQLDRLCILQCSVIEMGEEFSRICSFQITLWVALALCVFLVEMFNEYMSITGSIRSGQFSVRMLINEIVSVSLVISEVYFTSAMSGNVMAECRKTGIILNTPLMRRNIDARFKRSVEIYSGQILLNNLNITGMGLFPIDSSLMYSLVSTASSYLLILIQFELKST